MAFDQAQRLCQLGLLGRVAALATRPGRLPGLGHQGEEHVPVHLDPGAEAQLAAGIGGQVRAADAVGAEPVRDLVQHGVPGLVGHALRPDRPGQHVRVYPCGVGRQVDHDLRGQGKHAGLDLAGGAHGHRAEQGDLGRHRGVRGQVRRGCRVHRRRGHQRSGHVVRGVEQARHRHLLLGRDELGDDVQAKLGRPQLPARGDLPGPGGAGGLARDQVPGGQTAGPAERGQPLRLLWRRRDQRDQVVRRPGLRDQPLRPAGQHRPRAGGGQRVRYAGGVRLEQRQRLRHRTCQVHPVGRERGQFLTGSHQRQVHRVGPEAGGQFCGHRAERVGDQVLRAGDGDRAAGGLQVHQHPAGGIGADGHQARVQGGAAAVQPGHVGQRQPPHLAIAHRVPGRGHVMAGRGDPQVQVVVADVRGEHGRRRPALPL